MAMLRLLITGGTGSFGTAITKRLLRERKYGEIVIFSRDEKKQHDIRHEFSDKRLSFVVGDVRDKEALRNAMRGIDHVFHAAALKHVPTGEYFPMEVVQTNIIGTNNVFSVAEDSGVKKVVLLSTDKAVYPINAMGMTKALAEKLVSAHARANRQTIFCAVRYGNVMASRGSVIPLFIDYIKAGKPIPVTDPLMTRFLLSLDDAMDLVELALTKGKQGDLFIKKAPAATVGDLAEALLKIFRVNNPMHIVGIRAGEKMHETLATELELSRAEDLGGYFRITDGASDSYENYYSRGMTKHLHRGDYTSENTERLSREMTEDLLRSLSYIKEALAIERDY